MVVHYLYRITNRANGKIYIGQSVDPANRWRGHKYSAIHRPTMAISHAIKKYGAATFDFEVIASCASQDAANDTETALIAQYNSTCKCGGYNVAIGGNTISGSAHHLHGKPKVNSPETREKMRLAAQNRLPTSEATRAKCGDAARRRKTIGNKGKAMSAETRQAMSLAHTGKKRAPHSEATRLKMSEARKKHLALKAS